MKKLSLLAFAAGLAIASTASAAVVQYNDVVSFNAALPGGTSTLETFDGEAPQVFTEGAASNFDGFSLSYMDSPASSQFAGIYTAAQVNGGSGTALNGTNSLSWGEYNPVTGSLSGSGDGPTVTFNFFTSITAFAFDFSDSDSTDSYSVQIGSDPAFALAVPGGGTTFQSFFGFVSDTAFSTITFRQTATGGITETFSVDNIRTNGVSAPPPPVAAVPLPAAGWMLIAGIGSLAAFRRRKRT